jgi:hypothetical protein
MRGTSGSSCARRMYQGMKNVFRRRLVATDRAHEVHRAGMCGSK